MEKSSASYYRVKPFSHLSVYSRRFTTPDIFLDADHDGKTCELWYVQSGTVIMNAKGKEIIYPAGSVFCFVHSTNTKLFTVKDNVETVIIGCRLGDLLGELSESAVMLWNPVQRELLVPTVVRDCKICESIGIVVTHILEQTCSVDPSRFLKNRADFSELFVVLSEYCFVAAKAQLGRESTQQCRFCELACNYVRDHIAETIRVSDVARNVGISYSYLHQLFAKIMGMPLVEYINREKIRLVAQLLQDDNYNLARAGEAVGIRDTKYLGRLFHRHTGVSVVEFKKRTS